MKKNYLNSKLSTSLIMSLWNFPSTSIKFYTNLEFSTLSKLCLMTSISSKMSCTKRLNFRAFAVRFSSIHKNKWQDKRSLRVKIHKPVNRLFSLAHSNLAIIPDDIPFPTSTSSILHACLQILVKKLKLNVSLWHLE